MKQQVLPHTHSPFQFTFSFFTSSSLMPTMPPFFFFFFSTTFKVFSMLILFNFPLSSFCVEVDIKLSLIDFIRKLSGNNSDNMAKTLGWKISTDPCTDHWNGVSCNNETGTLKKIILEDKGFNGSIDASSLCRAPRLAVVSLHHNELQGPLLPEISDCKQLTHLLINGNKLSGSLPSSISNLDNLKRVDISGNNFSGELPNLSSISGLKTFLAQDNQLSGSIPQFDFEHLDDFNISGNLFTGKIPKDAAKFGPESFSGNPGLCGEPLERICQDETTASEESKAISGEKLAVIIGYAVLGFVVILFLAFMIYKKINNKKEDRNNTSVNPINALSNTSEFIEERSMYSISNLSNMDSPLITSALVVLKMSLSIPDQLSFENLLKAPAELLGKNKNGSTYKVVLEEVVGSTFVVKRVKELKMSEDEFSKRMLTIDRARHESVLSAVAFYCSKNEKLVLYDYQQNGSIFSLLHGNFNANHHQRLDWYKRLDIASRVANGLAFMHKELEDINLSHGNLKSTNILLDVNMNPVISEYGLTVQSETKEDHFSDDVFNFGVILLELLTGKAVQNNGTELSQWVQSVIKEEWTIEVFDKFIIGETASEEMMVRLLKVALLCMNSGHASRPSMAGVALMIDELREEDEERSIVSQV
ncbi:putative protein kinase RLK-Pelle-LRR-III family [Dioscorea sansibarensis]